MAAKRPGLRGDMVPPKKHYCPEHGVEAKTISVGFRKKIHFKCPKGCLLGRGQTTLK